MSDLDPVETTLTIDHDRKILMCWSNHRNTIKQWSLEFPDYCKVSSDGLSAEINSLPIAMAKKLKVSKRVKKELSEDERQVLRDRMLKIKVKN